MLRVGCKSDTGISRKRNEDAFAIIGEEQLFLVADGVGGNNAGEVASRMAVKTAGEYLSVNRLSHAPVERLNELFSECLKRANREVLDIGSSTPENRGMATTMVICHVREDRAYFANVGDSRAYLYADGKLIRITEDHTYVNALVRLGVLTEEEAKGHQKGHVITRAIGAEEEVEGDFYEIELRDEDILLLCTDGLYGEVPAEEMTTLLEEESNMQVLAEKLVERANAHGGRDNITVMAIRVMGGSHHE